jgi:hypothetical protein
MRPVSTAISRAGLTTLSNWPMATRGFQVTRKPLAADCPKVPVVHSGGLLIHKMIIAFEANEVRGTHVVFLSAAVNLQNLHLISTYACKHQE